MKIIIEPETEDNYEHISRLHIVAFNGDSEAKFVEKLRRTPIFISKLSLITKNQQKSSLNQKN